MDTKNDGLETIPQSPFIGGPSSDLHNVHNVLFLHLIAFQCYKTWAEQINPALINNGINTIYELMNGFLLQRSRFIADLDGRHLS